MSLVVLLSPYTCHDTHMIHTCACTIISKCNKKLKIIFKKFRIDGKESESPHFLAPDCLIKGEQVINFEKVHSLLLSEYLYTHSHMASIICT